MAEIMFCIYAVVIIVSVVIIANGCIKLFKDDDWRRNIVWWPKPKNRRNVDIEGALDRWHDRELQFQQKEAEAKKNVMKLYMDARITLQDVHDYVKTCPPLGQAQCTGCHIVCKDDCNHTYPVAYTDKPFYKLKLTAADVAYIRNKYPKFLECVDNLRDEMLLRTRII